MLTESTLLTHLATFANPQASNFVAFPVSGEKAAQAWADAAAAWAVQVMPRPALAPEQAAQAFYGPMRQCCVEGDLTGFIRAWHALANIISGSMVGYSGIPPLAILDLSSVYALGLSGASNNACLVKMAGLVAAWMRTGRAIPNGSYTPIPWS